MSALHDQDFPLWAEQQAALLKAGNFWPVTVSGPPASDPHKG